MEKVLLPPLLHRHTTPLSTATHIRLHHNWNTCFIFVFSQTICELLKASVLFGFAFLVPNPIYGTKKILKSDFSTLKGMLSIPIASLSFHGLATTFCLPTPSRYGKKAFKRSLERSHMANHWSFTFFIPS